MYFITAEIQFQATRQLDTAEKVVAEDAERRKDDIYIIRTISYHQSPHTWEPNKKATTTAHPKKPRQVKNGGAPNPTTNPLIYMHEAKNIMKYLSSCSPFRINKICISSSFLRFSFLRFYHLLSNTLHRTRGVPTTNTRNEHVYGVGGGISNGFFCVFFVLNKFTFIWSALYFFVWLNEYWVRRAARTSSAKRRTSAHKRRRNIAKELKIGENLLANSTLAVKWWQSSALLKVSLQRPSTVSSAQANKQTGRANETHKNWINMLKRHLYSMHSLTDSGRCTQHAGVAIKLIWLNRRC